ncbi:MAG: ribonuclease HI family protein [Terriglobales bacterium]
MRAARLIAYVDGGSRGNPGPAGYGVVVESAEGEPQAELKAYLGRQTNNYAEYQGLLAALRWAREQGVTALEVRADSELLVRQMTGRYQVRSPALRPLFEQARAWADSLASFAMRHVPREQNSAADRLANQAMDEGAVSI